jgi:hypothetical protein
MLSGDSTSAEAAARCNGAPCSPAELSVVCPDAERFPVEPSASGQTSFSPNRAALTRYTLLRKDAAVSQSVLTGIARMRGPKESVWAPVCKTMPTRKSLPSRWAR